MTTTIDGNSFVTSVTTVTNSGSPYTTSGEQYIYADSSTGAITVTLASSDAESGREIRIIDTGGSASTNNITVNTEGSETLNPGGNSSISITVDGGYVDLFSDGTNWFVDSARESLTLNSLTTEDLVDGAGISHTEQLSDLGQVFLATYHKTVGGGSITNDTGDVQVREPGNSSATSESRLYSHIFEFDPSVTRRVRVNLTNITIDNSNNARILIEITDDPNGTEASGSDRLTATLQGDGDIFAALSDNGSGSSSSTAKSNSYISSLNFIELSLDGSTLTVKTDDGSTVEKTTHSTDYPSGEKLFIKIAAADASSSAANNVDFDIQSVVFD